MIAICSSYKNTQPKMASHDHISDSDGPGNDTTHTPRPEKGVRGYEENSSPQSTLSHRFRESPQKVSDAKDPRNMSVMVAGPSRPWEYQPYQGDITVDSILEEIPGPPGTTWYKIEFEDGHLVDVSRICSSYHTNHTPCSVAKTQDEAIWPSS